MIKRMKCVDEVIDFVWEVSRTRSKGSYPRIETKDELENELKQALQSETKQVIGCYQSGVLCGAAVFYWIASEQYAQTTILVIQEQHSQVMAELFAYIGECLPGYELLVGIPAANQEIAHCLAHLGMNCVEASYDTRFSPAGSGLICDWEPDEAVSRVRAEQFEAYAAFHDAFAAAEQMFWTSARIKPAFERFRIYTYSRGDKIAGSIFVQRYSKSAEVFGLFIKQQERGNGLEKKLIQAMVLDLVSAKESIEEIIFFIEEMEEAQLKAAQESGFMIHDQYRCYKGKLPIQSGEGK